MRCFLSRVVSTVNCTTASFRQIKKHRDNLDALAGAVGIEPTTMVLETIVIPFNYAPKKPAKIILA